MPVRQVPGGFQWGTTGKIYRTYEEAARQGRAIEAAIGRRREEQNFVDALLRPDRATNQFIFKWEKALVQGSTQVQSMTRRSAMSKLTQPVKKELSDANQIHLDRMRTGYFDNIFLQGARTVNPMYVLTPADKAMVQQYNLEYYLKMRNARSSASRDSERFVSHLWEDTYNRRKMAGRKTGYLNRYPFHEFRGDFRGTSEEGFMRMDQRFGVKVKHSGGAGRSYNYGKYATMQGNAHANILHNLGTIRAGEMEQLKGRQVAVVVSDGPDCGWAFHTDGMKADGMVVTLEEARANPISHPNCVRRFSISTNPKDLEKLRKHLREGRQLAKNIAKGLVATGLTAYAASAASNIVAASITRFAASTLFENWVDHLRRLTWAGDPTASHMMIWAHEFEARFNPAGLAEIEHRVQGENILLLPTAWRSERLWPGGPNWSDLPQQWREVKAAGAEFLTNHRPPPRQILEFLDRIAPGRRTEEQFQLAYEFIVGGIRNQVPREQIISVVNAEAQRRNLLYRMLRPLVGEEFASKVQLTWTSWGQRLRVDVNDWLRNHITFTPAGLIRSLTFFPKAAVTGVVKMFADGSIGGHLSMMPKNFMNGIVRALVEVNEHGAVVGNIRIVPHGPLSLRLEFITRTPREAAENLAEQVTWFIKIERKANISHLPLDGVVDATVRFMQEHASPLGFNINEFGQALARRLVASGIIRTGQSEELIEKLTAAGLKLTFNPRDIHKAAQTFGAARVLRDLGYGVRQFRFNRAIIEFRVFNQSIFNIHANLRIPLNLVEKTVEAMRMQRLMAVNEYGKWSGTFRFIMHSPEELFKTVRFTSHALAEEGKIGLRGTIFPTIRFSGLRAEEMNPFWKALRAGNVRFLSRIHFDPDGIKDIATNMKIFGWNVYNIANVLKLRVRDVENLVKEGLAKVDLMLYRLGISNMNEAIPFWDTKVETAMSMLVDPKTGEAGVSRAEALQRIMRALRGESARPDDNAALNYLAGIGPRDTVTQIQNKLLHLRNWIRTVEARPDIVWRMPDSDDAALLLWNPFADRRPFDTALKNMYKQIGQLTDGVTFDSLVEKAREIFVANVVVPFNRVAEINKARVLHGFANIMDALTEIILLPSKAIAFLMHEGFGIGYVQKMIDRHLIAMIERTNGYSTGVAFKESRVPRIVKEQATNWKSNVTERSADSFKVAGTNVKVIATQNAVTEMHGALRAEGARGVEAITLDQMMDSKFMRVIITRLDYLQRRFPNLPAPVIRLVVSPQGVNASSYGNGIINIDWRWAIHYDDSVHEAHVQDIMNYIQPGAPLFRRYGSDPFTKTLFHEYGHYLGDRMSTRGYDLMIGKVKEQYLVPLTSYQDVAKYSKHDIEQMAGQILPETWTDEEARIFYVRRVNWVSNSVFLNQIGYRRISRQLGSYGLTSTDEFFAEAISHALTYDSPDSIPRMIIRSIDNDLKWYGGREKLPPSFEWENMSDRLAPRERSFWSNIFRIEIPRDATTKAEDLIKGIVSHVDPAGTPDEIDDAIVRNYLWPYRPVDPSRPVLKGAVIEYWTESVHNASAIRSAWMELHGKTGFVSTITDRDMAAALILDRMMDEDSYTTTSKLYRGIAYTRAVGTGGPVEEFAEHFKELTRVGTTFHLPPSSFSEDEPLAHLFGMNWVGPTIPPPIGGIIVEVEPGARVLDNPTLDIFDEFLGKKTEVITHGGKTFKVVSVDTNWMPDEETLRKMAKITYDHEPTEEMIQATVDAYRLNLEHHFIKVVLQIVD